MKNMGFHGSLNVPIEHHPTISYMVYNGYYKVMSNIPKMGQLITNHWILSFSNVGNNSPAPSYRFHRTFADGDFTLDFTDSDIDSAGISGTSKPWAGLMGKGSIILLHPIYLKLFGFRSPVMFCGFRFASHVTARAFEISVRRRRSGSWQLRYMERYFGVSTVNWEWWLFVCDYFQVYYIIADVRLKHEPVHLTMGMPSVEKPPSWCIRKSSSLGLEEPNTNTTYGRAYQLAMA
jgi:hypothetical protein